MAFTLIRFYGRLLDASASGAPGELEFQLSTAIRDPASDQVAEPIPLTTPVLPDGTFDVDLIASSDPTKIPALATYRLTKSLAGLHETLYVDIPSSAPGAELKYSAAVQFSDDPYERMAHAVVGVGSPLGVVIANPGTFYTNTSGAVGATMWFKGSGTGSAGWRSVVLL